MNSIEHIRQAYWKNEIDRGRARGRARWKRWEKKRKDSLMMEWNNNKYSVTPTQSSEFEPEEHNATMKQTEKKEHTNQKE